MCYSRIDPDTTLFRMPALMGLHQLQVVMRQSDIR
jgi:hypothetical protein